MNFNTKSVAKITGATQRQIDYWDHTNLVKPSVQEASGHGSVRLYSFSDLVQIKVTKTLKDKGITVQKIRKVIWWLNKNMPDVDKPLGELKFLTDGQSIFALQQKPKEIIDILKNGQLVLSIALGDIIEELKGEIQSLQAKRHYEVKVMREKYSVILHTDTEDGGYWVECPDIPGCSSQGDTVAEALEMIKDAIKGCVDVLGERKQSAKTA